VSLEERMESWKVTSYWEGEGTKAQRVFTVVEKDPDRPGGIRTVASPFDSSGAAEKWIADFREKVTDGQLRQGA
jgi:hypothetical protein